MVLVKAQAPKGAPCLPHRFSRLPARCVPAWVVSAASLSDFPGLFQAGEPALSGRGFREVGVVLEEVAEGLGAFFVASVGGERLGYEQGDFRRLAVGFGEGLLRGLERLGVLLVVVVGFGERPMRFPASATELDGLLEWGNGEVIFSLIGKRGAERR